MSNRNTSLARYRATTSREARDRCRSAMDAYMEALGRRTKSVRLQARQARLPFSRTARSDFAMIDYEEAMEVRR